MTMAMINEIGVYFSTLGSGIGIWFEIAIFAGTFVVALILKQYTESYKLRQALKKKKGLADESVQDMHVPRPKVTKVDGPPGLDTTYTRTTTRTPPGSRSKRGSLESKDSVRVFDDICAAKNPAASLETYEQMKASGMDKKLPEFEKSSRNTVQDFYNGLVQCAIRQGKPGLVDSLIADMRIKNASRTREFYESAMKMLAGKRFYREALQVHAQMQVDGIDPSPVTYSCLVNFAVEVGEVDLAVTFFEKLSTLQTPSIRAYMTILRAFSKRQDTSNSIKILKDMQTRNIELDSLVVNIVLGTLVNAGELDQAETLIHDMLSNDKPTVDVVSYNTLIKGYAQKGEMTKALSCLEKMSASGLKPNIITFNTAMDSAVRCKKPGEAWRLLNHMRTAALVPDKYTCSILVKGLHDDATTERVQECLALLHGLVQDAGNTELAQLCEVLFVSLLEASVKTKDSKLMLDVYQQVKLAGITSQAFNGLVRALAAEGELDHCLRVWEDMTNAGVSPHMSSCEALVQAIKDNDQNRKRPSLSECIQKSGNPGTVRTLVYALCKGRRTDLAIGIYKTTKAQHSQINLDLATCVALISAQCESSVKEAIKMLEDMKASGFRPDETVLNTLLSACFKEVDVNMGIKVFSELTGAGVRPNQTTFATLVKLYGRSQRLQEALSLVHTMESMYAVAPSMHTYSCLMQACIRNKQTGKALEIFRELKAKKEPIYDSTLFTTLIIGCAHSYSITQGTQLIKEAFDHQLDISPETVQTLISAAFRKRTAPDMGQLQELVKQYNLPMTAAIHSRLFA